MLNKIIYQFLKDEVQENCFGHGLDIIWAASGYSYLFVFYFLFILSLPCSICGLSKESIDLSIRFVDFSYSNGCWCFCPRC